MNPEWVWRQGWKASTATRGRTMNVASGSETLQWTRGSLSLCKKCIRLFPLTRFLRLIAGSRHRPFPGNSCISLCQNGMGVCWCNSCKSA